MNTKMIHNKITEVLYHRESVLSVKVRTHKWTCCRDVKRCKPFLCTHSTHVAGTVGEVVRSGLWHKIVSVAGTVCKSSAQFDVGYFVLAS